MCFFHLKFATFAKPIFLKRPKNTRFMMLEQSGQMTCCPFRKSPNCKSQNPVFSFLKKKLLNLGSSKNFPLVNSTIFFSYIFGIKKDIYITKLKKETFIINYLMIYLFKIYSGFLPVTPSRAGGNFFFPSIL